MTKANKPQVTVAVDGVPAACKNLNCDYMYVAGDASVTNFSVSGSTLTAEGFNLSDTLSANFAGVQCTGVSVAEPVTEGNP